MEVISSTTQKYEKCATFKVANKDDGKWKTHVECYYSNVGLLCYKKTIKKYKTEYVYILLKVNKMRQETPIRNF